MAATCSEVNGKDAPGRQGAFGKNMKTSKKFSWICLIYLVLCAMPAAGFDGLDVDRITMMAEAGDAEAQSKLGVLYASGIGIKRDIHEALKWYRKSAEQGDPMGQWNLAFLYVRGDGVAADFVQARELFRKSAESGLPNAQYDLGIMLLDGLGGKQDTDEAMKWFRKSAGQGYREAKKILKDLESGQQPGTL